MTQTSPSASTEQQKSGGNLASLTDRLKSKIKDDAQAISESTQSEQTALVSSLRQLSDAALISTQDAITRQNAMLQQQSATLAVMLTGPTNSAQTLLEQAQALKKEAQSEAQSLKDSATAAAKQVKDSAEAEAKKMKRSANLYLAKQKRLALMLLAAAGVSCLLACALIWGWWAWAAPWTTEQMQAGPYQVMKGQWATCNTAAGQKPCRPVN